jgi:dihydrofolate synthase/folylpolyglutamate synthase
MNYNTYYKKLFKIKNKISRNKILFILDQLGFKKTFNIFHVGGTNGKGSVANYLQQGFSNKYEEVGLFTSPHISKLNERIKINDILISDQDLYKYSQKVLKIEKNVPFTSLMYIIALLYFSDNKVKMAIFEVGIGGTNDDTSTIHGEYGAVVSIGMDHTEVLGNTIEKIALDKAGIMNKDMKFFISSSLKKELVDIFLTMATVKQAKLIQLHIKENDYKSFNKELAKKILETFSINIEEFQTPFARTTLIMYNNIKHIIDVGHNYPAIKASLAYLKLNKINYDQVCLSLSKDKDIKKISKLFSSETYVYQNSSFKARKIDEYRFGIPIHDLEEFINKLTKSTLFIGSFYFIGDVIGVINE